MGAVLLNGATIGRGSVDAAGAVVSQGVAIPPGSLVTTPDPEPLLTMLSVRLGAFAPATLAVHAPELSE